METNKWNVAKEDEEMSYLMFVENLHFTIQKIFMTATNKILFISIFIGLFFTNHNLKAQMTYTMPAEDLQHEGTWLQWPHHFEYGITYSNRLDTTWVAMTAALVTSEKVHIIAYNSAEQTRITSLLTAANVSMTNVDFKLFQTNDVWVRDNGPIFVRDTSGNLVIEDWGFNGWGGDYNFNLCNSIPTNVGSAIGTTVVNLNLIMTCEGGSVEQDGHGVFMATKSSILSQSNPSGIHSIRNSGMSQAQAEAIFTQYLGVTKFIWLNGGFSVDDVTDMHIDGFAKFMNDSTIVTMNNTDLTYWGVTSADITTLNTATNINNHPYNFVQLPLTANDVVTTYGNNLGFKGSYINYYVANTVVLVPNYNDTNDGVANNIIQGLYPTRTVVGIDVRNPYENGGMVHCVTQQQPIAVVATGLIQTNLNEIKMTLVFPNPASDHATIEFELLEAGHIALELFNSARQLVVTITNSELQKGKHSFTINTSKFSNGLYTYSLRRGNSATTHKELLIVK